MPAKFSLDDYVDVAERITLFKEQYPEGSLQTLGWEVREISDKTFIVYKAVAYRTPDDMRPGQGHAWEPFPGPTQYTRDSELMNAETAAWGRAIVAVGIVANRRVASRQEVKARNGDQAPSDAPSAKQLSYLKGLITKQKPSQQMLTMMLEEVGAGNVKIEEGWTSALTRDQASGLIEVFKSGLLPTGEPDIPNDPPTEPLPGDEPPVDDVPFSVEDARYEGTEQPE